MNKEAWGKECTDGNGKTHSHRTFEAYEMHPPRVFVCVPFEKVTPVPSTSLQGPAVVSGPQCWDPLMSEEMQGSDVGSARTLL